MTLQDMGGTDTLISKLLVRPWVGLPEIEEVEGFQDRKETYLFLSLF